MRRLDYLCLIRWGTIPVDMTMRDHAAGVTGRTRNVVSEDESGGRLLFKEILSHLKFGWGEGKGQEGNESIFLFSAKQKLNQENQVTCKD